MPQFTQNKIGILLANLYSPIYDSFYPMGDRAAPTNIPTYADANKFVTATADGFGDGSILSPWTLQQAMTLAEAGDKVGVAAGVYIGVDPSAGSGYRYTPAFRPTNSGTFESPIIFVAENPASLVTSGYSDIRSGATVAGSGWPALGVLSENYIQFIGFYLDETNSNNKGCADAAPLTMWTTTGSKVLRCKIRGEDAPFTDNHAGIRLENFFGGTVKSNDIEGFHTQLGGSSTNQAGVMTYEMQGSTIENNKIVNCGNCLYIKGRNQYGNTIRFNWLEDGTAAGMRLGSLIVDPVDSNNRNLIYGNVLYNCANDFELAFSATVSAAMNGTDIFNNTTYIASASSGSFSILITDSVESHDNTFRNNIVVANGRRAFFNQEGSGNSAANFAAYISSNRNLYFGATNFADGTNGSDWNEINFTTWKSLTTSDDDSLVADPEFLDVADKDLKLSEESPARNLGVDYKNILGGGTSGIIDAGAYYDENNIIGVI